MDMSWRRRILQRIDHMGSGRTAPNVHKIWSLRANELVLPCWITSPIASLASISQIP